MCDVAELNWFIATYLDERRLMGEQRKKTYWALVYAWKNKALDQVDERGSVRDETNARAGRCS